MKYFTIILVAFSLSGCIWQSVDQYDLQDAIGICGSSEKVAKIVSYSLGREEVICMNNTHHDLHRVKE